MNKLMLAAMLCVGLFATDKIIYVDDNETGIFYVMEWNCEVFNSTTGEPLDEDNERLCRKALYKDGVIVYDVNHSEMDDKDYETIDRLNRNNRERMYSE